MATPAKSDFVNVQLSPAGAKVSGGTLRIATPHLNYVFTASGSTRVLTSEWSKVLAHQAVHGQRLLQLVTVIEPVQTQPAAAKAAPPAPATPAVAVAAEASAPASDPAAQPATQSKPTKGGN